MRYSPLMIIIGDFSIDGNGTILLWSCYAAKGEPTGSKLLSRCDLSFDSYGNTTES